MNQLLRDPVVAPSLAETAAYTLAAQLRPGGAESSSLATAFLAGAWRQVTEAPGAERRAREVHYSGSNECLLKELRQLWALWQCSIPETIRRSMVANIRFHRAQVVAVGPGDDAVHLVHAAEQILKAQPQPFSEKVRTGWPVWHILARIELEWHKS